MVKRIIDGRTYNTDTSTLVAHTTDIQAEYRGRSDVEFEEKLYLTRTGAWFIVSREIKGDGEYGWPDAWALDRDAAARWLRRPSVDILDENALEMPPEAGEERGGESTIYLRVSAPLKERITAAAQGESVNAWVTRCVEHCLQPGVLPTKKPTDSMASFVNDLMAKGITWEELLAKTKPESEKRGLQVFQTIGSLKAHARYRGQHGYKVEMDETRVKMTKVK